MGYHVAQQLASTGKYHVLVGSRSPANGIKAVESLKSDATSPVPNDAIVPLTIDVANDDSIASALEEIKTRYGKLDMLINNAGTGSGQETLREEYRNILNTNVIGTAAVIDAFLPLLRRSTYHDRRIVNVTSGLGLLSLAASDSPYGAAALPTAAYRASKAGVNMLSVVHAKVLQAEGISVVAVSPGHCDTRMSGGQGMKAAADGAKAIVGAATAGRGADVTASYISDEGEFAAGW